MNKSFLTSVIWPVIGLMLGGPLVCRADSPREIAARVSPSVVLLVMEDSNGQPLAMGSGFVIRDGVVATNLHVVEGASRGYAKLADSKEKHNIIGTVAADTARDIVLLAIEGLKVPALTLGDSKQVAVGDEVYAVGNPRGLEGTFSAGIISSVRKVGDDSLLQITAPISPGSSGGPVVNSKGEVIGVAVATFKGGQNLNFAIPSSYVSTLASAAKPAVPLSKTTEAAKDPKAKSILEDMGGRNTDGVTAGQFLWTLPGHDYGRFTFSLRNKLRDPVKNVLCLVVFYDADEQPVETCEVTFEEVIAPGLAKRVQGAVDNSVQKLTSGPADAPRTKLEYRILYFDVVTGDEPAPGRGEAIPAESPAIAKSPLAAEEPATANRTDKEAGRVGCRTCTSGRRA